MLTLNKIIEILLSLQIIIISTFIPVFISIPFTYKISRIIDIPISWQVPSIILLTLIFKGDVVIKAFSIYLLIGLLVLPVFHNGGSLGYILTPNFGYLLGAYPLIKIIDKLNKNNYKFYYFNFLKLGMLGICSLHITGIIYSCIQLLYYKQSDMLLYNISKYSFGKIGYHLLMLTPVTLLIKLFKIKYRYDK